ncbi:Transcriptional regulator, MerR family [Cystobacter fuscus DSM 2262]|uniref:Transcriptional regulator, MerR family n=1 Tax=Cystobacter fuscus (strain ATCC 25194 / DSM 2262 / NBRC 100088 / M29) TaxID=1242864 RepID=S9PAQ2_CYSF2|nr:helix-turn-helix domain-containing protein [Cystobacter fuscus]EPX60171.1 Transcriptional regulator, MerR family [Cystobacter fuscus DSM 2262]
MFVSQAKTSREWKLSELAEAVGVTPRTVRYYVQRGLLPAPPFKGPDTVYGEEHLLRLKAIRVLQARFLPLDAIQVELARLTPEALQALAEAEPSAPPPVPSPAAPAPAPVSPPESAAPSAAPTSWRRWELAPGLELHLADTADAKTRALAEHLRALLQQSQER